MTDGGEISKDRLKALRAIESVIGHKFKNRSILDIALTHPSFAHEKNGKSLDHYERLEFIGDAVLDLAVSEILFTANPSEGEGYLTRARADLVNKGKLAEVAVSIGLGQAIRLGKGEGKSDGEGKPRILAAALEAVIGAVFMDGGWKAASKMISILFGVHASAEEVGMRDPRSRLQEYTQKQFHTAPDYMLIGYRGPAHDRIFRVAAYLEGKELAVGEGKSKKEAGRNAAQAAYEVLIRKAGLLDENE